MSGHWNTDVVDDDDDVVDPVSGESPHITPEC